MHIRIARDTGVIYDTGGRDRPLTDGGPMARFELPRFTPLETPYPKDADKAPGLATVGEELIAEAEQYELDFVRNMHAVRRASRHRQI